MKIGKEVMVIGGLVALFLLTQRRAGGGAPLLDSSGNPIPPGYYQDETGAIVKYWWAR